MSMSIMLLSESIDRSTCFFVVWNSWKTDSQTPNTNHVLSRCWISVSSVAKQTHTYAMQNQKTCMVKMTETTWNRSARICFCLIKFSLEPVVRSFSSWQSIPSTLFVSICFILHDFIQMAIKQKWAQKQPFRHWHERIQSASYLPTFVVPKTINIIPFCLLHFSVVHEFCSLVFTFLIAFVDRVLFLHYFPLHDAFSSWKRPSFV